MALVDRLDRLQRRHRAAGFPIAVVYKYVDDSGPFLAALAALGHATEDDWSTPLPPADAATRRQELRAHAAWAREHLAPWVQRRMRGRSSGDLLVPKRPDLTPVRRLEDGPEG